jgi:hypothetical protein
MPPRGFEVGDIAPAKMEAEIAPDARPQFFGIGVGENRARAMHNGVDDFALVHAIDGVQKLAASGDVLFLGDHRHQEGRSDAIEPVGIGLDVYRICPIFLFTAPAPFYNLVHSIEAFPGRRPLPGFFCLIVRKPAGAPGM